ncbi:MAG: hypothetical protein JWL73_1222 [Actinomycetia bacterium]|nr:hypothetical protein [Actinomycetes bacterium]
MADTDDKTPSGARRAARLRRRKHWRLGASVLGVLAALAVVLLATGAIPLSANAGTENTVAVKRTATTNATAPGASGAKAQSKQRALDPAKPLQLWIAGDSLAGALGISLGQITADTGVVSPTFDSRPSTGLENPSFYNWPQHATQELARLNPEAVVFIVGANDGAIVTGETNDATHVPAWKVEYRTKVDAMMDLLVGPSGRTVYWVGAPIMRDTVLSKQLLELNQVFVEEAAKRSAHVTYIDSYRLFSDSTGKYANSLPDPTGTLVRMRTDDGIHFTSPAGGDRIADAVFKEMDADWHITDQAVANQPQVVHETKGSRSTPPGAGSSFYAGTSTRTTAARAATTAPPATRAPVDTTSTPTTTSAPSASTTAPSVAVPPVVIGTPSTTAAGTATP